MGHIKNYKQFIKSIEKQDKEIESGISEQENTTATATAQTEPTQATTNTATPSVESDPNVISARTTLANAIANRDKAIAAKQKELTDLKAAQDALVNAATNSLNTALAAAAKKPVT